MEISWGLSLCHHHHHLIASLFLLCCLLPTQSKLFFFVTFMSPIEGFYCSSFFPLCNAKIIIWRQRLKEGFLFFFPWELGSSSGLLYRAYLLPTVDVRIHIYVILHLFGFGLNNWFTYMVFSLHLHLLYNIVTFKDYFCRMPNMIEGEWDLLHWF